MNLEVAHLRYSCSSNVSRTQKILEFVTGFLKEAATGKPSTQGREQTVM